MYCTGVTATTWTGCVRGLSFQGGSLAASTTLAFAHNAGYSIVISNVGQFYTEYVSRTGNQDVYDIKTFYSYPKFATTSTLPTQGNEFATKTYVDGVGAGGFTASNVSTTRGLSVDGSSPERVGINASTTRALAFDSDGKIYVNASTTQGLTFGSSGDLQFDPTKNFTFTGNNYFTASSTFTNALNVPYATASSSAVSYGLIQEKMFGNGSDGALSLTSGNYLLLNTASKYVYQYTSVSITGNSKLSTGSNLDGQPLYILVQGDLTITSASTTAVDRIGNGATGATGSTSGASGANGTVGNTAMTATVPIGGNYSGGFAAGGGGGGGAGWGNDGSNGTSNGGTGPAPTGGSKEVYAAGMSMGRVTSLCHMGGGGAAGAPDTGGGGRTGGSGGNGGGCIVFIVGGNINVTSTLSVAGNAGGTYAVGGGGGGGGGGGSIAIFYNGSVTANTGTYTVSGGGAGSGSTNNGGAGGAGQSVVRKISSFLGL